MIENASDLAEYDGKIIQVGNEKFEFHIMHERGPSYAYVDCSFRRIEGTGSSPVFWATPYYYRLENDERKYITALTTDIFGKKIVVSDKKFRNAEEYFSKVTKAIKAYNEGYYSEGIKEIPWMMNPNLAYNERIFGAEWR